MMQSGYASSVDGNIFWTAVLPGANDPSSSEYPVVGGIATVLEFVRELPKEDLLARDHDGRSALHLAAHLGKEALGHALMIRANEIPGIKHRIMHARDHTTQTILGTAIWSRCSLQFIECLIHHGTDVNPEMAILNPLHLACWFGWSDLVDLLLRHGASPEKRLPDGKTALDLAREQGHHNIVQLLGYTPQGSPRSPSSHTPQ
jgi:ankyrin repeat protein